MVPWMYFFLFGTALTGVVTTLALAGVAGTTTALYGGMTVCAAFLTLFTMGLEVTR